MDDQRLIPLSALQHFAFCPRQCALIHNAQVWDENWLTAQGQLLHQRVDQGGPETRKGVRYERGVLVNAPALGLTGKLDLLEKDLSSGHLLPVEYKRGKPKKHDADAIQLCAQAFCLEEMTGQTIVCGALWYWQIRRRTEVELTESLRSRTLQVIKETQALLLSGEIPHVRLGKHCLACSLREWCQPDSLKRDHSTDYIDALFLVKEQ
ncbi:MAG: CRISPR-associated protein Cas4 [Enterobacteriaceae bacterium]